MKPEPDTSVATVKDFWESHVNNEYYTQQARASDAYFDEIEERRYRAHYNLVDLFDSLDPLTRADALAAGKQSCWLAPVRVAPRKRR